MFQATRTSAIRYSFAFASLFIATTFAMSEEEEEYEELNFI